MPGAGKHQQNLRDLCLLYGKEKQNPLDDFMDCSQQDRTFPNPVITDQQQVASFFSNLFKCLLKISFMFPGRFRKLMIVW